MNIIICAASFAIFLCNLSVATPIQIDTNVLQNLPLTLLTIEEKLTNLEKLVTIQCGTIINEKLELYGLKTDNIEKTVSKLGVGTKLELEKIASTVKDEFKKQERILRNAESVYDTINHKLVTLQDVIKSEMKNTEEAVISKLEKIEESIVVREGDLENELTETLVALDDLKITFTNLGENMTRLGKISTEKISKYSEESRNYHMQLQVHSKNISETVTHMQEALYSLQNQTTYNTEAISEFKDDVLKSVKNYANKFTQLHLNLGQKTDSLDLKLQQVAVITNLSRSELQNNLRSLIVQLGRLAGKQHVKNDYYTKLEEFNKKVDANFQNILLSQNLFLDSCHRVQMNEEQIESHISIVLNKLLDIFENNTSITANDIKELHHTVHVYDSNMKSILSNQLQNVLSEITRHFNDQKQNIDRAHALLQDHLTSNDPILLETILKIIQNLQSIIEEPHKVQQNYNNLDIDNVIENISFSLKDIDTKMNYFLKKCDGKDFSRYIQNTFKHNILKQNLSNLITNIFGKLSKNEDGLVFFDEEIGNFNASWNEIENTILLCNLNGLKCSKVFNSTYVIVRENDSDYTIVNCLQHYVDENVLNCTVLNSSKRKCLPSYHNLIHRKFNTEDLIKCTDLTEQETGIPLESLHLSKDLILDAFDIGLPVRHHSTSSEPVTELDRSEETISNFIMTNTGSNSRYSGSEDVRVNSMMQSNENIITSQTPQPIIGN